MFGSFCYLVCEEMNILRDRKTGNEPKTRVETVSKRTKKASSHMASVFHFFDLLPSILRLTRERMK